jgi:hypothetical protein
MFIAIVVALFLFRIKVVRIVPGIEPRALIGPESIIGIVGKIFLSGMPG